MPSIKIAQGESHGLIVRTGAGKTTMFNLIAGSLKPSGCAVLLTMRIDDSRRSSGASASGSGRTFQIPRLFRQMS